MSTLMWLAAGGGAVWVHGYTAGRKSILRQAQRIVSEVFKKGK